MKAARARCVRVCGEGFSQRGFHMPCMASLPEEVRTGNGILLAVPQSVATVDAFPMKRPQAPSNDQKLPGQDKRDPLRHCQRRAGDALHASGQISLQGFGRNRSPSLLSPLCPVPVLNPKFAHICPKCINTDLQIRKPSSRELDDNLTVVLYRPCF